MNTYFRTSLSIVIITLSLIVVSLNGCSQPGEHTVTNGKLELSQQGRKLTDIARFLAGGPIEHDQYLKKVAATPKYKEYQQDVEKSWDGFFRKNMDLISTWREKNIPQDKPHRVFYPFSGPDILHPLVFFPTANDIIMFGLEPTGGIPGYGKLTEKELLLQKGKMLQAINFILDHAFFVTTQMMRQVKKSSLNGTSAIMFFFLAREGYDIHSARNIYLDSKGQVKEGVPGKEKGMVKGIEITFSRFGDKKPRRLRYYQINIANGSPQLPRFTAHVKAFKPEYTIIKSASYLMSYSNFTDIRDLVLKESPVVLQDDSGLAYKDFARGPWNIDYYGKYHKPLKDFKHRYQEDLKKALAKNSKGPIPFVYGYGYGYRDMTYHIIIARKKVKK